MNKVCPLLFPITMVITKGQPREKKTLYNIYWICLSLGYCHCIEFFPRGYERKQTVYCLYVKAINYPGNIYRYTYGINYWNFSKPLPRHLPVVPEKEMFLKTNKVWISVMIKRSDTERLQIQNLKTTTWIWDTGRVCSKIMFCSNLFVVFILLSNLVTNSLSNANHISSMN